MTSRRQFALAAAVLLGAPRFVLAQAKSMVRIGVLRAAPPSDRQFQGFLLGLRELGYAEGKSIAFEYRQGDGEQLEGLARDLIAQRLPVIFAPTPQHAQALHRVNASVPIVVAVVGDPVRTGLAASLAHPGGNITGGSVMAPELGAKRLQLLRQVLAPSARALGVMWNPAYKGMSARFRDAQAVAPSVGMDVRSLEVSNLREMEALFEQISKDPPAGLLLLADPLTLSLRARIVEFAREKRLPAIYEAREFVDAGGLMSYGANVRDMHRRSAYFVDRILKGAKPAELPVEQPVKFELALNIKTARQLGLAVDPIFLARVDEVIQ